VPDGPSDQETSERRRDAAEQSLRSSLEGLGLPVAQLLRLQPGGTLLPRKAGLPVEALQLGDA
jgi:hypothetical protein